MLNFFYLNAITWIFVIILYLLGWSNVCVPLTGGTVVFFALLISLSLVLGYAFREEFHFRKAQKLEENSTFVTLVVILVTIVEIKYARNIPLIDAFLGRKAYGEFNSAIPGVHTILVTFCTFYAQYIFYLFISFPHEKRLLRNYIILILCSYGIWFSRMGLSLILFMSFCILLASISEKIRLKHIIITIICIIAALYLFGVLGNIRMGYSFNDNSLITAFSRMSNKYPSWMPKQFLWAYIYILGPLANFNYNLKIGAVNYSLGGFLENLFPDFISSRIFGKYPNYVVSLESGIGVTVGYGSMYQYSGVLGLIISVFYFMLILGLIVKTFPKDNDLYIPTVSLLCAMTFFMFFVNTLNYTPICLCLIYPYIMKNIKFAQLPRAKVIFRR